MLIWELNIFLSFHRWVNLAFSERELGARGGGGAAAHQGLQTALIDERELKLGIISPVPPDDLGAAWLEPS